MDVTIESNSHDIILGLSCTTGIQINEENNEEKPITILTIGLLFFNINFIWEN